MVCGRQTPSAPPHHHTCALSLSLGSMTHRASGLQGEKDMGTVSSHRGTHPNNLEGDQTLCSDTWHHCDK